MERIFLRYVWYTQIYYFLILTMLIILKCLIRKKIFTQNCTKYVDQSQVQTVTLNYYTLNLGYCYLV